jgi:Outer membrane protein beta-barrel domain
MRSRPVITALLAIAGLSAPLAAQSAQRWSLQASGLYVGVLGDAYDGLKNGVGGEVQLRVTPSLWSYGAGLQYSSHALAEADQFNVALTGIFFEPRRVFDIGSAKVAPYVSARLAYLQQSADLGEAQDTRITNAPDGVSLAVARRATLELSASGFQGNVGGGVLVKLSPRINLDLGLTLGAIRFGDAVLKVDGRESGSFDGTSGTGQNAVVRAGLAIGLGGGAKKSMTPAPTQPSTRRR